MSVLDQLSNGGEIIFTVPIAPVSQQADGKSRRKFQANVKQHMPKTSFLLSGDVHLDIYWRCSEVERYESHKSLDVDNIAKPLIDSLVGEILIDDTQLISVLVSWVDWELTSQELEIRLRCTSELVVRKQGLEFVEFNRGLCLPVYDIRLDNGLMADKERNIKAKLLILDIFEKMLTAYDELRKTSSHARTVLPQQRVFHRNKLTTRWQVTDLATKRAQLQMLRES